MCALYDLVVQHLRALKGQLPCKIFSWFSYIWVVLDVITSYSKSYNLNCSFLEDMAHRSCTVQIHPIEGVAC